MTNNDYPCWRCEGKGRIQAYSHVVGGTCFKCHGTGRQKTKPRSSSIKFAVFALNRETGKMERIYNMSARSSAVAIRCAETSYGNASSTFRDIYTMEGAVAVRVDELDDPIMTELP